MKKSNTLIVILFCFFGLKGYTQTTICANDSVVLHTLNHQYGTLEWEKSQDGTNWEKIHNEHSTTYKFLPKVASYYRAVNKFPTCEPGNSTVTLVQKKPIANAGEDRLINDTFLFLGGNTAIGSTGMWTIIQGTGGVLTDASSPNSKFTGTTQEYKLLWTLQNACGTSNDTLKVKFVTNQYHDKLVIVDATDTMLSSPQQLTDGNYIIEFNTPVPVIDNQTILIGTTGNGFLRKVDAVTQNGNTFTMTTSQGKLKDVFVDGGFELGNVFHIDTILPTSRMAHMKRLVKLPTRAQILSDQNLRTGVHYFVVNDGITSPNNGIQMERTITTTAENPVFTFTFNNTLVNQGGLNIHLDGGLAFTPNVYADYEKTWFHTRFNTGLNNSTVVSNYKFTLINTTNTQITDSEFSLFTYSRLVYFLVGGVPVMVNVAVDFNGKASANVATNLTFVHEFVNTITTNAGIGYTDGLWTNHYSNSVVNTLNNDLNITGTLTQDYEIGPKISFRFYNIVGPYIEAKLTEDLSICVNSTNLSAPAWKVNLNLGSRFVLGTRAEVLGHEIFDYSKNWENRELYTIDFPHSIEFVSGNNQQYTLGLPLPESAKVRVMSNKGFAVPGVFVKFEPVGGGSVGTTYVMTNLNGYAMTTWTPNNPAISKLSATVVDCEAHNITNSPLIFKATELAGIDCTQTTLYGDYLITGNVLKPTAHMGVPPYTYSLDNSNYSSTIPQITMTTGGNYSVTIKDANGCMAYISYYNGPVNCNNSGLNVQLQTYGTNLIATGQGGRPPYLYALDASTTYTATNVFSNITLGIHTVKIKDANDCLKTSTINVTNSTTDTIAYFTLNNNTPTAGQPIEFTNLSNNAATYLWNFGDGTTSTQTNPTHYYNTPGSYTVTLTAYNGTAQHTYTQIITITIGTTNTSIATAYIPAGTFIMGSPITEPNRGSDETQHQVTLSAFRMSKYEITNAQYAAFLNANNIGSNGLWATGPYPSNSLISTGAYELIYTTGQWSPTIGKANVPVTYVGWYGATSFAQYVGGRLPTEAEWEYAARANTTTAFNTGDCLSNTQANYYWGGPQTGCTNTDTTYLTVTLNGGSFASNAFGLYDMHGNVLEWCSDWYGTYSTIAQTNPTGSSSGTYRVFRGGAFDNSAKDCRSSLRLYGPQSYNNSNNMGFRVVFAP